MKKVIKTLIQSNVDLMDKLIAEVESHRAEVQEKVKEIVKVDKEGKPADSIFNAQRFLVAKISLLEQDLMKTVDKVAMYYNLAKDAELDLGFDEKMTERLDFIKANENSFFVLDKGKVTPRDTELLSQMESRINSRGSEMFKPFLESLRNSEVYTKEDNSEDTETKETPTNDE